MLWANRPFLAFERFTSFKAMDQIVVFYPDDQQALVTLQLSAFCDTAYHAAFAIKTSIKPICC